MSAASVRSRAYASSSPSGESVFVGRVSCGLMSRCHRRHWRLIL